MVTIPPLTWHRYPGLYTAKPVGSVLDFAAAINRDPAGGWLVRLDVHGRPLSRDWFRTLGEAKHFAGIVYADVETAAR